jgi:hypothetical protein
LNRLRLPRPLAASTPTPPTLRLLPSSGHPRGGTCCWNLPSWGRPRKPSSCSPRPPPEGLGDASDPFPRCPTLIKRTECRPPPRGEGEGARRASRCWIPVPAGSGSWGVRSNAQGWAGHADMPSVAGVNLPLWFAAVLSTPLAIGYDAVWLYNESALGKAFRVAPSVAQRFPLQLSKAAKICWVRSRFPANRFDLERRPHRLSHKVSNSCPMRSDSTTEFKTAVELRSIQLSNNV